MTENDKFNAKFGCDFLYSVYDDAAEEYGPLYQCVNDNVAVKRCLDMLRGLMTDEFNRFGIVDADNYARYGLYSLGMMDRLEGIILPEKRGIWMFDKVEEMVKKFNERGKK